jgi:hypothetical protein
VTPLRQAMLEELRWVHARPAFQRLTVRARVEDEVVRPHVIHRHRWQRSRTTHRHPAPWPTTGDLEPRLAPEAMSTVCTHPMALALEEDPNPPKAIARILRGQAPHRRDDGPVPLSQP